MIKSMTGFSKVDLEFKEGKLYGEARALNNRYLEISLKLPKIEYTSEQKMRDLVKRHVKRGKVDIIVKWEKSVGEMSAPKVNENAVKQYLEVLEVLRKNFKLKGQPTIENVLSFRDIITFEENNGISEEKLLGFFKNLLKKLDKERSKEGELIEKDLTGRLKKIRHNLKEIEKRWPLIIKTHGEKLREKMLEVVRTVAIDEVRVLQELAIYMEKLDIAEEIIRLKGHMENFNSTLGSDEAIGRKLDFIIQEMVRETNTIGSKSNDLYINERVVQIKVDIEKMREQVQNVE
jgi:uncharacterized protein (TIGR00255 family)